MTPDSNCETIINQSQYEEEIEEASLSTLGTETSSDEEDKDDDDWSPGERSKKKKPKKKPSKSDDITQRLVQLLEAGKETEKSNVSPLMQQGLFLISGTGVCT